MIWYSVLNRKIIQLSDGLSVLISFFVAYFIWRWLLTEFPTLPIGTDFPVVSSHLSLVGLGTIIWVVLFSLQKSYSNIRLASLWSEVINVLKTVIMGTLILIALIFLFRMPYIPRSLVIVFIVVNSILLMLEKYAMMRFMKVLRSKGYKIKKVLLVGTGIAAARFVELAKKNHDWGIKIIGFLEFTDENVGNILNGIKIIGTNKDVLDIMHSQPIDEVLLTVSDEHIGEVSNILNICKVEGVQVRILTDFIKNITDHIQVEMIDGIPVISVDNVPFRSDWMLFIKRTIDLVGSIILIIALSPIFLITAMAVKLSTPGPILYKWNVVGLHKKPFTGWKFRTMYTQADDEKHKLSVQNEMSGPVFKMRNDPRITPIGRFLRKYSLDELPQLWSVFTGDMGFVGPRPAGPHELKNYENWHRRRLSIKPGITCIWQVNGRNEINSFDEWAELDLEYIDNWSLWLDIKIMAKTIPTVLSGKGW